MSTLTPYFCKDLAGVVAARGASFLDAPVVGSRPQADAGQLVHLVGGSRESLAAVADLLACWSSAAHYVGASGSGAALKLLVNALFASQVTAVGELLGVARRADLDLGRVVEILGTLSVTSPAAKGALGLIQARRCEPMFPISLVEKDLRYALTQGERSGSLTSATRGAQELFARALAAGLGDENITAVAKLFD